MPDEFRKAQHSSVETLLLSGSVDFSTPAEYATHELLPLISNGKQVILAEMGHTNDLWNVQRPDSASHSKAGSLATGLHAFSNIHTLQPGSSLKTPTGVFYLRSALLSS